MAGTNYEFNPVALKDYERRKDIEERDDGYYLLKDQVYLNTSGQIKHIGYLRNDPLPIKYKCFDKKKDSSSMITRNYLVRNATKLPYFDEHTLPGKSGFNDSLKKEHNCEGPIEGGSKRSYRKSVKSKRCYVVTAKNMKARKVEGLKKKNRLLKSLRLSGYKPKSFMINERKCNGSDKFY